jgi:hypothetical protein
MSAFLVAMLILACGVVFGALGMWFFMDGRVSFWQDKFVMERRLKEKLLGQSFELANKQLTMFHDLRGAIGGKK